MKRTFGAKITFFLVSQGLFVRLTKQTSKNIVETTFEVALWFYL